MGTYYEECKAIARTLTGAHTTFTFDHIIREPDLQFSGGGHRWLAKGSPVSNAEVVTSASVHMDYTDEHDVASVPGITW